ncbi:MAG: HIT domain-containing protein [Halobacteriaceae archaeon]
MEQVFAPWRIEWVERDEPPGEEDDGCVFCRLPAADDDRESLVVARSAHAYVLLNNYPYNPGHAMVIPDEHAGRYDALSPAVTLDHARLTQATLGALRTALSPDGFNTGMNLGGSAAGGSIDDHVHTHVVPRWSGDTNFMAVISDTTVIVEALADTYERLHAAFGDHEAARAGAGAADGADPTGAVELVFD